MLSRDAYVGLVLGGGEDSNSCAGLNAFPEAV